MKFWNKDGVRRTPKGALAAQSTVAKVPAKQVYLVCKGQTQDMLIEADLHDELYQQTRGGRTKAGVEIPPELMIVCPRCGSDLMIDGHKKKISVEYLGRPRWVQCPVTGEPLPQIAVVSVKEVMECPHPEGKTVCGFRFRITNNRLYRV